MITSGIGYDTIQEWDRMFFEHETKQMLTHGIPYEFRKGKYARWESRSTTIGGSDTKPHSWN